MSSASNLVCPSGRGSASETPLMVIRIEMTRTEVYGEYVHNFEKLAKAVDKECAGGSPRFPPSVSAFARYLDKRHPTLKVSYKGSDFCDFCVTMRN